MCGAHAGERACMSDVLQDPSTCSMYISDALTQVILIGDSQVIDNIVSNITMSAVYHVTVTSLFLNPLVN